jgi:VWFA-related protein
MRRLLASLIAVALLSAPGLPQSQVPAPEEHRGAPTPPQGHQTTAHQRPAIRATVNMVLIDVQVTDRADKPIKGLKPEQFTLFEDNKPQKISSFDYYDVEAIETAAAAPAPSIVVPLGTMTPSPAARQALRDHRMLVIFFDLTAMQPAELLRAREAAGRYVSRGMTPADLVSVVVFGNRLRVLANFTNDRELLGRALKQIAAGKESELAAIADAAAQPGEASVTEDTSAAFTADETEFNIFNTDRKLEAVESLADLLRGLPGRKSVVYFTGGITQTGEENMTELRAATDAANRSNTSLYSVDARGLLAEVPGGDASKDAPAGAGLFTGDSSVSKRTAGGARAMFTGAAVYSQVSARHNSRDTLATLAADTGGRAFFDLGDLSDAFRKVQQDSPGTYLLGYYSQNSRLDGSWRRVKLRVSGVPGAHVRFRTGYYAPKDDHSFQVEDRERQLADAMRAETPFVEFPVALETDYFSLGGDQFYVPIAAKLDATALEWAVKRGRHEDGFDFAAEVRNAKTNRVVAALRDTITIRLGSERFQQLQHALVYQGGVVLGPGEYRLKFLARENETGRIGTFEQALVLAPLPRERMELSSVVLSSQVESVRDVSDVKKKTLGVAANLKATPLEASGERIILSVTRVFDTQQQLYVFFQAYSPRPEDRSKLRAGLVFFRDGAWAAETPLVSPTEVDSKTQAASFRINLPLEKLRPGRYTVQAVAVDEGAEQSAFARSYFAVRTPPQ